ncbi:phosphoenolpyruvate mutase [Paenibacillus xylanilyticus]|uniref:phosphoenolpyruvate mutase n=1 Tax=Paenibacillus xylanilyticus TaxID=248903 RepID=A0A7Y6EXE1_9BACL|nr:phosphoenolpyruvate mutase [Paenibacillus xylanilyticus]NUU78776.1 phosphoenolpyruvate mutase [Paenibacillus xylanilyticus]
MKAQKLRSLFAGDQIIQIVGAHDGLSAKLVEEAGFDGIWASGLEISAVNAVPDANILTMTQYLQAAASMDAVTNIPVIADCDSGYGNVNNVMHLVREYERNGIAAVCMEDKLFPKLNSFAGGEQKLATIEEFSGKIRAAKDTQRNPDFMVIARIEALIAGAGMDEAVARAEAYEESGADAILIHSKKNDPSEILHFLSLYSNRLPIILVPTTYPQISASELQEYGVKMVIYANHGLRTSIHAIRQTFQQIKLAGNTLQIEDKIASVQDVFKLQGLQEMLDAEDYYTEQRYKKVEVPVISK